MWSWACHRPKTRHTSLALYVLIRGVALLMRCGNKPDAPPLLRRCGVLDGRPFMPTCGRLVPMLQ